MKRIILIIVTLFASVALLSQNPTNYKEGDFNGKQVKAKSIKLYDNWLIEKNSSGTMTLKYNGTSVATLTAAGTFAPTNLSSATITGTTLLTAPAVTATTTLTLPGAETLTKTTSNANSTTHSGSFKITDTLRIGSTQWLRQSTINKITTEGSVAAADTIFGAVLNTTGNITSSAGVVTAVGMYGDFFDLTTGDTLTNALGRVVFIAADSSLYVCRSIVSPHNYWKVTH